MFPRYPKSFEEHLKWPVFWDLQIMAKLRSPGLRGPHSSNPTINSKELAKGIRRSPKMCQVSHTINPIYSLPKSSRNTSWIGVKGPQPKGRASGGVGPKDLPIRYLEKVDGTNHQKDRCFKGPVFSTGRQGCLLTWPPNVFFSLSILGSIWRFMFSKPTKSTKNLGRQNF